MRLRQTLPPVLFLLALVGCGDLIAKLKGDKAEDAGFDGAVVVAALADAGVAPVPTETAPGTATALTPATNTAVVPRPVVKTDGGALADAGAVKTDGGAAPAPTPAPTIPPNLLDAGGNLFKNFDAGGFKPPFVK